MENLLLLGAPILKHNTVFVAFIFVDKRRAERAQGPQAVARPRAENAPPGVRRRGNRRPRGMVVVDDSGR